MWDGQCKAGQMCRECYHRRTVNLAAVIASERKALEQEGEEAGCYQNLDLPYGQCATFENEEVSE